MRTQRNCVSGRSNLILLRWKCRVTPVEETDNVEFWQDKRWSSDNLFVSRMIKFYKEHYFARIFDSDKQPLCRVIICIHRTGVYQGMHVYLNSWKLLICAWTHAFIFLWLYMEFFPIFGWIELTVEWVSEWVSDKSPPHNMSSNAHACNRMTRKVL